MIKIAKLVTGENIVADVEDFGDSYFFKWPVAVSTAQPEPGDTNPPQNRIEPFCPHVKGHSVNIAKARIVYMADPIPMLQEYYEKNFGSLIPTPQVVDPGAIKVDEDKVIETVS